MFAGAGNNFLFCRFLVNFRGWYWLLELVMALLQYSPFLEYSRTLFIFLRNFLFMRTPDQFGIISEGLRGGGGGVYLLLFFFYYTFVCRVFSLGEGLSFEFLLFCLRFWFLSFLVLVNIILIYSAVFSGSGAHT